jgi:hypothetical protein
MRAICPLISPHCGGGFEPKNRNLRLSQPSERALASVRASSARCRSAAACAPLEPWREAIACCRRAHSAAFCARASPLKAAIEAASAAKTPAEVRKSAASERASDACHRRLHLVNRLQPS